MVFSLICGLIFVAYLLKTHDRNKAWKDDFTLFSTDMKHMPESVKVHDFLGNIYSSRGDSANDPGQQRALYEKAIGLQEKAVAIYPSVPEIQQKLGFLYGKIGRFDKAIEKYRIAIRMNPNEVHNYIQIGNACGLSGEAGKAIPYLESGRNLFPDHPGLLQILGMAYATSGQTSEAIICFEKILQVDPENAQARQALGYAYTLTGKGN
jgi:tetratricopeptide (TPR) repeat protein